MKEIYYYETTDDAGMTWWLGKPSFSLVGCVDKARRSCYPYRITKVELKDKSELVSYDLIEKARQELEILDKIFQ